MGDTNNIYHAASHAVFHDYPQIIFLIVRAVVLHDILAFALAQDDYLNKLNLTSFFMLFI
jgi:hypothetical protein